MFTSVTKGRDYPKQRYRVHGMTLHTNWPFLVGGVSGCGRSRFCRLDHWGAPRLMNRLERGARAHNALAEKRSFSRISLISFKLRVSTE
jgi:hypothetical protein